MMIVLWSFMFAPSVTYFTDVKGYLLTIVSAIVFSAPLLKKWSTIGFGSMLAIVGAINIMHMMSFGTVMNEYSILSTKRTTMDESIAFISSIDKSVWIASLIYLFLCVLVLLAIRLIQNKCNFPKKIVVFGVVAITFFTRYQFLEEIIFLKKAIDYIH